MKKYDRLILAVMILYVPAALAVGCFSWKFCEQADLSYRVDENRLVHEAKDLLQASPPGQNGDGTDFFDISDDLLAEEYPSVVSVSFLEAGEKDRDTVTDFYQKKTDTRGLDTITDIVPIYIENDLTGYLRMDVKPSDHRVKTLILTELCLLIPVLVILAVLWYVRTRIVSPFLHMQNLTHDMSRGNLKGEIKQEKNHYFGELERNLSMMKDELEVKKKRELELLRDRKLLLLSLSHDIKTPLSTIRLYDSALLQGEYDTEEKRSEIYRQISLKCNEIEKYMEELLTSSREDIVEITMEKEDFYLRDLMERVLGVYREKCEIRKIKLTVEPYENRLLYGDPHRLAEVFENLFENAFKYGDGRRIDITFEEEDCCQLIRVFNSGEPVTENDFVHLFESFFRGSNTRGRQGYGLGLYIAGEIMRKMNGELFAERQKDGMTFVLVLPL